MYVYKITNIINGKIYVGQTTRDLYLRFKEHARSKTHCVKLYYAIKKYGHENFKITALYEANNLMELNEKEIYFIEKYNSVKTGYNILKGGNNRKLTEEIKQKISLTMKGKSPGRLAIENSAKINRKKVYQYDLLGGFIAEHEGIEVAARKLGIKKGSNISRCCKEKVRIAYGFQWRYIKKDTIGPVRAKLNPNLRGTRRKPEKSVARVSKDGKILDIYRTLTEAAKINGISISGISAVCKKTRNSINGHNFIYVKV